VQVIKYLDHNGLYERLQSAYRFCDRAWTSG
jgi:hypothetical protein